MPKLRKLVKLYREQRVHKPFTKLQYRTIRGRKGEGDLILQVRTADNKWANITFLDILKILDHLFKNEDRIYGHAKGRSYLFRAITELFSGRTIEEIYYKYGDHKEL